MSDCSSICVGGLWVNLEMVPYKCVFKTPGRKGLLNPIGTMAYRFSLVGPMFMVVPFSFSGFLQIPSMACQVGSPGSPPLLFDMAGLGLGWKRANPRIGYFAVSIVSKTVLPLVSHFCYFV